MTKEEKLQLRKLLIMFMDEQLNMEEKETEGKAEDKTEDKVEEWNKDEIHWFEEGYRSTKSDTNLLSRARRIQIWLDNRKSLAEITKKMDEYKKIGL